MGIYYFIIAAIVIECAALHFKEKTDPLYRFFLFADILFISFVVGLRDYSVGHDTYNYSMIYSRVIKLNFEVLFTTKPYNVLEKGYLLLMWLFGHISTNPSIFFLAVAIFEFLIVGMWLYKYSQRPLLSLLIFVCMFLTFFLTGIRQNIAMAILLLAYHFLREKKYKWFVAFVLLASTFHVTSLVFLTVFFIQKVKSPYKYAVGAFIAYPILYATRSNIFLRLTQLYERYENYNIMGHGDAVTYTTLLGAIVVGAMLLRRFIVTDKVKSDEVMDMNFENYQNYTNMVATAFAIMPFVGINGNMLRIAIYFSIFVCLLIVDIYHRIDAITLRSIVKAVSIIVLILLFFKTISSTQTYQYEFISWENVFSTK